MTLTEFYPLIKTAHIALVLASGTLFAIRGAAVLAGRAWPMTTPPRVASVAIDTLLLAAGIVLWWMLSLQPLRETWLGAKLLLLVAYVALGTLALKCRRGWAYAAAIACFVWMVTIARTHHPLGLFRTLL